MANLESIKKRINSIEVNNKIIVAMKVMATYKLKKFKNKFLNYQDYLVGFYDTFLHLINDESIDIDDINHQMYPKGINNCSGTLWIVIGSDIGMCGGYNTNVLKKLSSFPIQKADKFFVFGNKIYNLVKNTYPDNEIVRNYTQIDKYLEPDYLSYVGQELFSYFQGNNLLSLKIIYTKFINNITFTTSVLPILPLDKNNFFYSDPKDQNNLSYYELRLNINKFIFTLFVSYLSTLLYGCLLESKTSEYSSRFLAMSTSSDNANKLIGEYRLEYNKVRQSTITQEIIEIISGSIRSQ